MPGTASKQPSPLADPEHGVSARAVLQRSVIARVAQEFSRICPHNSPLSLLGPKPILQQWQAENRRADVSPLVEAPEACQCHAVSVVAINSEHPLCLGSASPRRRELLSGLSLPLRVVVGDIDEEPAPLEPPLVYLERVVNDKLQAVAQRGHELDGCAALLVADTIVRIDDDIIGKPRDPADAFALLQRLSGREHVVHTRYAISLPGSFTRAAVGRTVTSRVRIRTAPEALLRRYAATGEGLDKAGAYAVQGIGAFLVEAIHGSYSNVVGLPVCEVVSDLMSLDVLA
ncbi:MAG TPA: Maf family protein, partial [Polyangiaceae bacterium]|nr:Maf family protein [Polyangiaceae bacterium]